MAKVRNPLEPLSTAVKAAVTLIAALICVGLYGAFFIDGVRILGVGDPLVCVTNANTTVDIGEQPNSGFSAAPGATVSLGAHPNYCTEAPSTVQSLLNSATRLIPFVFVIGALLLAFQLIRGAERDGLYTAHTAARLRRLGWWLLAGSVLTAIAVSTAEKALINSLSHDSNISTVYGLFSWEIPFMAILTGLGVLSFSRIMRIGVAMREDLDAIV